MPLAWPDKDPGDRREFGVSGANAFDSTETVASVVWTVPSGLTLESQAQTGQVATVTLSGGTAGTTYTVTAAITTTKGTPAQIWERDVRLRVVNI